MNTNERAAYAYVAKLINDYLSDPQPYEPVVGPTGEAWVFNWLAEGCEDGDRDLRQIAERFGVSLAFAFGEDNGMEKLSAEIFDRLPTRMQCEILGAVAEAEDEAEEAVV